MTSPSRTESAIATTTIQLAYSLSVCISLEIISLDVYFWTHCQTAVFFLHEHRQSAWSGLDCVVGR